MRGASAAAGCSGKKYVLLSSAHFGNKVHDLHRRALEITYCCCDPSQKMVYF